MKSAAYIVPLASALMLAGCASQMARQEVAKLQPGETIAVVSLLSDKPKFYGTGTTVFNNIKTTLPATSWNFNSYIESLVARDLADARYKPVKLDSAQLMLTTGPALPNNMSWLGALKVNGGDSALIQDAKEKSAGELLVIGSGSFEDPWLMTDTYLSGFGVFQHEFLGIRSPHATRTYVELDMWLINVNTGNQTGAVSCREAHSRWLKFWISKPSDFTKANADYTLSKLHELIGKAESACMEKMGFKA